MAHWLLDRLEEFGQRDFLAFDGSHYSYRELSSRINHYLQELSAQKIEGEVVAITADYSFHSIALFFALTFKKCVVVPITNTVESEINERIEEGYCDKVISVDVHGNLAISNSDHKNDKHQLIQNLFSKERAGLILFSSGSTGKPKSMIHDLDNLLEMVKEKKPKGFCFMVFLMFDHIGGLNTLLNCVSMGARIVIPGSRDAEEVCALIEKEKVQILPTSPTFLNLILISGAHEGRDLSSLKMITYGTEPMPESLLKKLKATFPRVKFLQTFGTSETGILQAKSQSSESTFIKIEDPNTEYKIVEGELWLKSKTRVLGYLNSSMERFTDDGWYKTGDLVEETEDGYLKIVGRNQEVINVGGQKVLPLEVESVIMQLEEITDCMVYPEPNSITGQSVATEVSAKEGMDRKTVTRLIRKHCKENLDSYKVPTKVNLIESIEFSDRFKKRRKLGNK